MHQVHNAFNLATTQTLSLSPHQKLKKKKFKKKSEWLVCILKKKITSHDESVLAQAHILALAEASAFVPNMLSETPSYFLDAFLISSGSCISTAKISVMNNKHSISSPVELFRSAYLEFSSVVSILITFSNNSTLCNRPFSFMKDKNDCIFHFIFWPKTYWWFLHFFTNLKKKYMAKYTPGINH